MFIKTIIQGRLEFGNEKSYQKVFKMFEYRTETYYKSDIMLDQEEVFNKKMLALEVPRYVGQHLDKTYRNTVSLLEYSAQFAISGEIRAWQTDKGTVLSYAYIEPESDKAAVVDFRKGKELVGEDGREQEALEALSNAIEKYNNHAYAYEKRGEVNYMLKKYHDSLRDFNKCLAIDDSIPDDTPFIVVKKKALEVLDQEKILLLNDFIEENHIDETELRWQHYEEIQKQISYNLRHIFKFLDFIITGETNQELMKAVTFVKALLAKGIQVQQDFSTQSQPAA